MLRQKLSTDNLSERQLWLIINSSLGLKNLQEYLQNDPSFLDGINLNGAASDGPHEGTTIAWWLAYAEEGQALLQAHPALLSRIDLNAAPVRGQHQGKTIAYLLADNPIGRKVLQQANRAVLDKIDFNAGPNTEPLEGRTVAWVLAAMRSAEIIFQTHPELLDKINLNAMPLKGDHQGITVAWWLVHHSPGRATLQKKPTLLEKVNLNAAPVTGRHQGETIAFWLAVHADGQTILQTNPALLDKVDLNASAVKGKVPGATVGWLLAKSAIGQEILRENPSLLYKIDLNTAPTAGDYQGITVASWLASGGRGRIILQAYPALLNKCNLDARDKNEITVWQHLLYSREDNEPAIQEALLQIILTLRGLNANTIADVLKNGKSFSREVMKKIRSYQQIFAAAKKSDFVVLERLIQETPWLSQTKEAETGDTLLHVIIQSLMNKDKHHQALCLAKFEKLFKQFESLKNIENNKGLLPVDYTTSVLLQKYFSFSNSELEKVFNMLFQPNKDLFFDVMSNKCNMQDKINVCYWKTVENVEMKVQESMCMDALVEKLQQAFDQLFSYMSAYPDDFTFRTAERMNRFVEAVEAERMSAPTRVLDEHEVKTLKHCANNLIMLAREAYIHYRKSIPLSVIAKNTSSFFSPGIEKNKSFPESSNINKMQTGLSQRVIDAIAADDAGVIDPYLTDVLARSANEEFAEFITALINAEYGTNPASMKKNIRIDIFVNKLLKNQHTIDHLLAFDLGVWFMLTFVKGIEVFKTDLDLMDKINLNAVGPHGVTIAWLFANAPEGRAIFQARPTLLSKINLNAAPLKGVHQGVTVAWWLAFSPPGLEILRVNSAVLDRINLNASPVSGIHHGETIAWLLANTTIGREILKENPALLDNVDLNMAPAGGANQGETIALLLAKNPEGRSIFDAFPALLEKCHLDVKIGKQRTVWQHLLFSRKLDEVAISEPLLQKLLTVHGLDPKVSCEYITSPNIVKMIEAYREAFSMAEKGEFAGLEEQLQKLPWLCDIKKAETGDTLLHVIIQRAMLDKSNQETCLKKFEKLLALLQPLQNVENKARFLPGDYASGSLLLQNRFSGYESELEKEFNLLFQTNVDLFCDVLSGVGGVGVLVERLTQIIAEFSSAIDASPNQFITQTQGLVHVLTDIMARAKNDRSSVEKFGVMFPMRFLSDAEVTTLERCVNAVGKPSL